MGKLRRREKDKSTRYCQSKRSGHLEKNGKAHLELRRGVGFGREVWGSWRT